MFNILYLFVNYNINIYAKFIIYKRMKYSRIPFRFSFDVNFHDHFIWNYLSMHANEICFKMYSLLTIF